MLVSLNWLKQYVDISGYDAKDLAEKITRTGIEVESVSILSSATNVVIGHVLEREQHPDADKLSVLKVNIGELEPVQIVCGAKNVAADQKVLIAKIGAVLPGDFKIKKSKLRGVESHGMCCSLKELGIEQKLVPTAYSEGIFVCGDDAVVGMDAIEYLNFYDTVIELGLTPNRMDCLSMLGVAYEVAAILERDVMFEKETVTESTEAANSFISIESQTEKCPTYLARVVKNVEVKESPLWLQSRLIAAGMRPKNNVVDITNYVMLELGQPLHAFDLATITTNQITVREARNDEEIETLDNQVRKLASGDIVVTDGQKPIAIAGVMGGADTEVRDMTSTILIESASFNRQSVRKTSSRLGLRSESSARFEKGIDPVRVALALERAASLMTELANGDVCEGIVSVNEQTENPVTLEVSVEKINSVLGTHMSIAEVANVWDRLKFAYTQAESTFIVNVPSRRLDITIVEDLIEEAGRIYGYDNIPTTIPRSSSKGGYSKKQALRNTAHQALRSSGLSQVITYSLTNETKHNQLVSMPSKNVEAIRLAMPMSEERSVLRQSIVPSLLEVIGYNKARTMNDVFLYEIGNVYTKDSQGYHEEIKIAGALTGSIVYNKWQQKSEVVDFFTAKGVVESVLGALKFVNVSFAPIIADEFKDLHPGRSANVFVNDEMIGVIGQIHPKLQKDLDLTETYVFEISFDKLIALDTCERPYEAITKFPSMTRDIALVVKTDVLAAELVKTVKLATTRFLESVEVFDVYEGVGVQEGHKSVAMSLTYLNREQTLTDEMLQPVHQLVLNALEEAHQAVLRK